MERGREKLLESQNRVKEAAPGVDYRETARYRHELVEKARDNATCA